jgi:hypothetical protein
LLHAWCSGNLASLHHQIASWEKNFSSYSVFSYHFSYGFLFCLHSDTGISLPTFIIAECVLIYLDPESTRGIVGWASKTFSTAAFFLYEQVLNFLKANWLISPPTC